MEMHIPQQRYSWKSCFCTFAVCSLLPADNVAWPRSTTDSDIENSTKIKNNANCLTVHLGTHTTQTRKCEPVRKSRKE